MLNPNFANRDKCPACTSCRLNKIYQSPFDSPPIKDYLKSFYTPQGKVEFEYLKGATYLLYECEACGLIFQGEVPDENLMERLYTHWIDPQKVFLQHHKQYKLGHYLRYAQEIMQIIAYFNVIPSSLTFFDFGMGWGEWALMAKAFGCESYGYELSKELIRYAKKNGIKVVSWEEIPQHQFDFINTEQVFEHISKPLETLCYLKMALKTGGVLKISVPTANDIEQRLEIMDWRIPKGNRNSLNPVAPLEHINFFRRKSIVKMAEKAGMKEVFIPMKIQYLYTIKWLGKKRTIKNILTPINRNILKKQNYLLFCKMQ
jgi:2-polyprenyl-3-methyl-5-hydroxy-6-metoxy-1,4-benzoquinol methylase